MVGVRTGKSSIALGKWEDLLPRRWGAKEALSKHVSD